MAPRVFVSYVRDNLPIVNRLVADLRSRGVDVWFDRDHLPLGAFWRDEIRVAVQGHDFFLACFSEESRGRERAFMREELQIAINEVRLRGNASWFLPILISGEIPDISIGPNRSLRDIQFVELTEANWADAINQVCRVVKRGPKEILVERLIGSQLPSAVAGDLANTRRETDYAPEPSSEAPNLRRRPPLVVLREPNVSTPVMLATQWVLAVFTVAANYGPGGSTAFIPFWLLPLGYLIVRFVTVRPMMAGITGGIGGAFIGVSISEMLFQEPVLPDLVSGMFFGALVSWYMAKPTAVSPIAAMVSTLLLLAGLGVFSAADFYWNVLLKTPGRPFVAAALAALIALTGAVLAHFYKKLRAEANDRAEGIDE